MATKKTTTTATNTAAKTRTKSTVASADSEQHDKLSEVKAKPKVKTFDSNEYVTVKNGFHGTLFYRDYSTGETYQWN